MLGLSRVFFALASAGCVAAALLEPEQALRACCTGLLATIIAGLYGNKIIGGVIGDFLGATICIQEVAIYLALSANFETFDPILFGRLAVMVLVIGSRTYY